MRVWPNGSPQIPVVTAEFGGDHELTGTTPGGFLMPEGASL